MTYTIDIARQRFCLWAACRAAQAGSAKAKRRELIPALNACGVVDFIANPLNHTASLETYDEKFDEWVANVQIYLEQNFEKVVMYGVAAKLVSTYLKGAFVLGGYEATPLSRHIAPPIDSILLKSIDSAHKTKLAKQYKWQKLTKQDYRDLLCELRRLGKALPGWHLEKDWRP